MRTTSYKMRELTNKLATVTENRSPAIAQKSRWRTKIMLDYRVTQAQRCIIGTHMPWHTHGHGSRRSRAEYVHRVKNTGFGPVRLLLERTQLTQLIKLNRNNRVFFGLQWKTNNDYLKFTAVPPHRSRPSASEPPS